MDVKNVYWYIIDKTIRETKKIRRWENEFCIESREYRKILWK